MTANEGEFCHANLGELGEVMTSVPVIPGLYLATMKMPGEKFHKQVYFVERKSNNFSNAAKAYGKPVPGFPDWLIFFDERTDFPSHILDYEAGRYKAKNGIPISKRALRDTAACGAELYPDYFGPWLPPYVTPWGFTTRYKTVANGIFCLETESLWRGLALSAPVCDALSPKTLASLSVPSADGLDPPAYRFVEEDDACIAFFELSAQIAASGFRLPMAALKNTLCIKHPEYVREHNKIMRSLNCPPERFITRDAGAGTDFVDF